MTMTAISAGDPEDDDPDFVLPDVGVDTAPSSEDIVAGKVGNGTYDRFTPELSSRIQDERAANKREVKIARKQAYEEGMKDALVTSAALTTGLVGIGAEILERLESGEVEMDRLLLDTLKLANTANKDVPDRAIGKAKSRQEVSNKTQILNIFHGRGETDDYIEGRSSTG